MIRGGAPGGSKSVGISIRDGIGVDVGVAGDPRRGVQGRGVVTRPTDTRSPHVLAAHEHCSTSGALTTSQRGQIQPVFLTR